MALDGPFLVWIAGFVSVFSLVAMVELSVLFLRLGARAASGEDPS